jgi:hypothetical protein
MSSFSKDQKIAFLAVPTLLFGVLGAGYTLALSEVAIDNRDDVTEVRDVRERDLENVN